MDRLNLGCGNKKFSDFLNVDIRPEVKPDIILDISDLSQFENQTFSYILAMDILEHFPHARVWPVLTEWVRCLKIGGQIEIQVPSIDRIYKDRDKLVNNYDGDSSLRFSQLIFGGQGYQDNFHCVFFTPEFFKLMPKRLGLEITKYFPEIGLYNHKVIMTKIYEIKK